MPDNISKISGAGWSINQSIILELDTALFNLFTESTLVATIKDFKPLLQAIPDDFKEDLKTLLEPIGQYRFLMEAAATLADVIPIVDYSQATMEMRELTLVHALDRQIAKSSLYHLQPDRVLQIQDQLVDLAVRTRDVLYDELGVHPLPNYKSQWVSDFRKGLLILSGEPIHDRFWHWMDRFYYEYYQPWRISRQTVMDNLQTKAEAVLGSSMNDLGVPPLDWLSEKSPLLRIPQIKDAVETGKLKVHFWVEPFGLADTWLALPGEVFVSFAEPGEIFENFYSSTQILAKKIQALADPTRLIILRLIRNMGMTNTDMAEFLQISRPTVSIHAKILREAGLIRSEQDGRIMRHEIIPEQLHRLLRDLNRLLDLPPDVEK